jgi:hypothetical protein
MPAGNQGTSTVSELDISAEPSFLSFLDAAATAWRRLPNFPRYDGTDQRAGDELVDSMATLLADVDPVTIDRTATLPEGLIDDLRAAGFLALRNDAELGGRQASDFTCLPKMPVTNAAARSTVSGAVCSDPISSTSGMTGTGLKKCTPTTRPGRRWPDRVS